MEHLDEQRLTEFAAGALAPALRVEASAHLERCAACRKVLDDLKAVGRGSTFVGGSADLDTVKSSPHQPQAAAPTSPGETLARGTTLGRYLLIERLGSGGMGDVFVAFDPRLDRKVALKLLRAGLSDAGEARARLLREAQAMARLSHPNVITVHDVGTFEDRIFVAMELVEGETLGMWLRTPHPWHAVLDAFVGAGRGLAAAHRAGLVHRDFKPDNVLIGQDDGRPRVLDFGLARQVEAANTVDDRHGEAGAARETSGKSEVPTTPPVAKSALDSPLTLAGTIMGTPGYMALEQLKGQPIDARTDQFSFCVALFEALFGHRPFGGSTFAARIAAIEKGELPPPPEGSKVPPWVRQVLARGLSAAPEKRFASMDELLTALTLDRRRGRKRLLTAAAALALIGLASAAWAFTTGRSAHGCSNAGKRLAGVWDPARKRSAHAAFVATAQPYAEDAWRGVERALDGYTRDWVAASTAACLANRVQGTDSDEVFALRTLCLEDHLKGVSALVDLYRKADAEVVANAIGSARSLANVSGCADLAALNARRPVDAATRDARDAVRGKLIDAKALHDSGKYAAGVESATAALAEATRLNNRALAAEAGLLLGKLQDKAGASLAAESTLFDSALAAEASREDEISVRAWGRLAVVTGTVLARPEAGRLWARLARAAMDRLGPNDTVEAELEGQLGSLDLFEKKYDEALTHFERSRDLWLRTGATEPPELARAYNNVGVAESRQGRLAEALASYEKALELQRHTFGDEHPDVASSINNLGVLNLRMGAYDKAEARYQEALAIRLKAFPPDHPEIAGSEQSLGNLFFHRGLLDEALSHHQRALAIRLKAFGASHPLVAETLNNLGDVLDRRGDHSAALADYQTALEVLSKKLGNNHPSVASAHENVGVALEGLHRLDRAQGELDVALALRLKSLGSTHADVARTYKLLGELSLQRGRPERALAELEKALAIRERVPSDSAALSAVLAAVGRAQLSLKQPAAAVAPLERAVGLREKSGDALDLAEARFLLAQALAGANDLARATALAGQARDAYAAAGPEGKETLQRVQAWLAGHGLPTGRETP